MDTLEKILVSKIGDEKFNEIQTLNSAELCETPSETKAVVQTLLKAHKENCRKNRNDLSLSITVDHMQQLDGLIEHLDRRLKEHTYMLRQNEGSLSTTNTVLECDSAKYKADKLAEILRAKITWTKAYDEIKLLEPSDRTLRYQKLVALQNSFNILSKYTSANSEKIQNFEQMKDEFLSWFSSATVLAIDTNDSNQLESLREKYLTLSRISVFEQIFGTYAKNKIKCFIEEDKNEHSIWNILQEIFSTWRRCYKLAETFVSKNASKLIAESLYDGISAKWEHMSKLISDLSCTSETPFIAAREVGKICNDFLVYAEKEGDEEIYSVFKVICQKIFFVLSKDYGKHVTSVLLCTINKITIPEKGSRYKHNWLLPYIDEIHSCMREMVNEACGTFGANFSEYIVPSFDRGIKELCSLISNQDILNVKGHNTDVSMKKTVHENTEDKISAICVAGSLLNVVDNINAYINDCYTQCKDLRGEWPDPKLISNQSLLERLNRKVLARKIEAIANSIILSMNEEMMNMKLKSASNPSESVDESMQITLPSFSITPHNYITNVGHGLLNAMNTISLCGTNKNFIRSIMSVSEKHLNEDESDLWILTEIGSHVMEAFCRNVGNVDKLDKQLARQFNADVVFLMEALIDLRLQPTPNLISCADKLKKAIV